MYGRERRKKRQNSFSPVRIEAVPPVSQVCVMSITPHYYDYKTRVNFSTYVFSRHKLPAVYRSQINRDKHKGVFPGKMCSDSCKIHGCGQQKKHKLALLYLASGTLPYTTNSSHVPTEFPGGVHLSVPYTAPMMSALRINFSFVTVIVYNSSVYEVYLLCNRTQRR